MQSITAANETSTLSAKPTTETQGKNNRPASPPQSLLTTKTLAEQSEKTNELTPSSSTTIQRPEVEVTIKPPNNIEFNPPISAENISTLIETGLSGSSAVDDISRSKEQAERQQLLHEAKIGQNNNNNKDLVNILTPFTTGFALWQ
ncbi:MAG TPA: hypothetical protein VFJ51_11850, partial [Nitrososphaeraceae archaeon]|nr:hypothetical protein [Nitrososphaeraceae archaeon]